MKYFFVPGRISNLAIAELRALTQGEYPDFNIEVVSQDLFIVTTEKTPQEVDRLFNRLGGFVKYGKIIEIDSLLGELSEQKKVIFGISVEENFEKSWDSSKVKQLSEQIKEGIKDQGGSSRYILPKNLALNSGQVIKNGLLTKGFELVIFNTSKGEFYGTTLGIQDIDLFTLIDYGKPHTDKGMGVLPVKLARILINLTGIKEGKTVWDPFCGSGTIPLSALLIGLNAIASDVDEKAVRDTEGNISWLASQDVLGSVKYNTFTMDVTKPSGKILRDLEKTEIDAVVCEPFMGPPQYRPLPVLKANELLDMVTNLYTGMFEILGKIKKRRIKAVVVIPSFKTKKGWVTLSLNNIVGKDWDIENKRLIKGGDLHWERPNSIIRRNIFILSKRK